MRGAPASPGTAKPGVGSRDVRKYSLPENALEFFVDLIITDNEAVTLENALHQMGFRSTKVMKKTHWEITVEANPHDVSDASQRELVKKLIASGELLNTNKEIPYLRIDHTWYHYRDQGLREIPALLKKECNNLLVRYNEDYEGDGKLKSLHDLGFNEIRSVKKGVVWQIEASQEDWVKILETSILFNPYSQTARYIN